MFQYIYQWIENIAFYLVVITAVIQLVPNNSYKKYIRFFTGLILVILLANPIMKIFQIEETFEAFYEEADYERKLEEIEDATKYLEDISFETQ